MREFVFYVPKTIKVGRCTFDHNQCAISCKSTNFKYIHEKDFLSQCGFPCSDNIKNPETELLRDISNSVSSIQNNCIDAFQLICQDTDSWRNCIYFLKDPRGFIWRIDESNILYIIIKCKTSIDKQGFLKGKFCYSVNTTLGDIWLLKENCDKYEKAIKEIDIINVRKTIKNSIDKKNLKVGAIYRYFTTTDILDKNYDRVVYLGEMSHIISPREFRGWLSSKSQYDLNKLRKYIDGYGSLKKLVFLRLKDNISDKWTYQNGKYCLITTRKYCVYKCEHSICDLSSFIESQSNNYEFDSRNLIIVSKFNSKLCRQLDDDQRIIVTVNRNDFFYNRNRDFIIASNPHFQFQEYIVDELRNGIRKMYDELYEKTGCIKKEIQQ